VGPAVLLAHAALLGGALRLTVWRDRQPAIKEPPLVVQLLTMPPARAPRAPSPAPERPAPARPLPARREPQAITLPVPEAAPAAPAAAASAPAPVAADGPASAPAPLDLRLPRSRSASVGTRNPALDDPRSNTPRAALEDRIGAAMGGDGRWVAERIDNDRVRFRRGGTCVEVQRSRAEQLDSFNSSYSPKPWAAKKPEPC